MHKMTSRLPRTSKIGTGKVVCTRNPRITFKTSKNQLFLSYCTCLPKFGRGITKSQKSMWYYWKMKIFFSVCSTQFELYLIQIWSFVLFRLAHNLSSKTGIFLHHDYSVLLFPLEDKKTQTLFSAEWKAPVAKIYHNIHFPCCYS